MQSSLLKEGIVACSPRSSIHSTLLSALKPCPPSLWNAACTLIRYEAAPRNAGFGDGILFRGSVLDVFCRPLLLCRLFVAVDPAYRRSYRGLDRRQSSRGR